MTIIRTVLLAKVIYVSLYYSVSWAFLKYFRSPPNYKKTPDVNDRGSLILNRNYILRFLCLLVFVKLLLAIFVVSTADKSASIWRVQLATRQSDLGWGAGGWLATGYQPLMLPVYLFLVFFSAWFYFPEWIGSNRKWFTRPLNQFIFILALLYVKLVNHFFFYF